MSPQWTNAVDAASAIAIGITSKRIEATFTRTALSYVSQQRWQTEIIVVNDGCTDDTAEIVHHYARLHPIVRLVQNPGNCGKGYSVRNGMLNAHGNVLLFSL